MVRIEDLDPGVKFIDLLEETRIPLDEMRKVTYDPREAKVGTLVKYLSRYGILDVTLTTKDGQKYRVLL